MITAFRVGFVALSLLVSSSPVDAADPVIPDDKFVYCSVCHGVQLKGNRKLEAPRLSGMEVWYVEKQLEAFSKSWRGAHEADVTGMEMRPMAAILTAEEIEAVARYVNSVDSARPKPTVEGDHARGESLYATCAVCHGANGEGNEALGSPALADRNDWYLARQIRNFRDGVRGGNPADTYGIQMRAAAGVLPDDEAVDDIVAYLNTLRLD